MLLRALGIVTIGARVGSCGIGVGMQDGSKGLDWIKENSISLCACICHDNAMATEHGMHNCKARKHPHERNLEKWTRFQSEMRGRPRRSVLLCRQKCHKRL